MAVPNRCLAGSPISKEATLVDRVLALVPATTRATRSAVGGYVRAQRRARGWSQLRLIHSLRLAAADLHWQLPDDASMIASVSRWENGHRRPGEFYRRLLCVVFDLAADALEGDLPAPAEGAGISHGPRGAQPVVSAA